MILWGVSHFVYLPCTVCQIHSTNQRKSDKVSLSSFSPLSHSLGCQKLCSESSQAGPKSGENSWIWRGNWRRTSCASATARRTTCRSNTSVPKKRRRRYWCLRCYPQIPTSPQKTCCWVIISLLCSLKLSSPLIYDTTGKGYCCPVLGCLRVT